LAFHEIGNNALMTVTDSAAAPARPLLLIVDDDQELCSLLVEYLAPEGFAVELLNNGTAALERLAQVAPDLVVLDVMLPELSGFEVLRRIRSTSAVPVIMLTARGEEVDRAAQERRRRGCGVIGKLRAMGASQDRPACALRTRQRSRPGIDRCRDANPRTAHARGRQSRDAR
jgi:CheY-like chemotaxis protein